VRKKNLCPLRENGSHAKAQEHEAIDMLGNREKRKKEAACLPHSFIPFSLSRKVRAHSLCFVTKRSPFLITQHEQD
jgi:hypothetical protein